MSFKIRAFAGGRHPTVRAGGLLMETAHKNEASACIEVEAWQARMKRGEVSHAELIDLRPGGTLTNLNVYQETKIPWSWRKL